MGHHKHGHTSRNFGWSKTYSTWVGMRERCDNPNNHKYHLYGGRGVKVCEEWENFQNFLKDMGERPSGKTLDRKDPEKGYYKDNCRWATYTEQNLNLRIRCDNTSGRKGVSFHKATGCWRARGNKEGMEYNLYHGPSFEDACEARLKWEQQYGA